MKTLCKVQDCLSLTYAKGFCSYHYKNFRRTGKPESQRPRRHGTPIERFWRHVSRRSTNECWEWKAFRDKDGYGKFRLGRSNVAAHRFSYQVVFGKICGNEQVLHSCNNPPCVNPRHLKIGTHLENMQDRREAGNYATGESHPGYKFSTATVKRVALASGSYKKIAEHFGMSKSHVRNIKLGYKRPDALA